MSQWTLATQAGKCVFLHTLQDMENDQFKFLLQIFSKGSQSSKEQWTKDRKQGTSLKTGSVKASKRKTTKFFLFFFPIQ